MWILLLRESGMSFYPRCYRLPEDLLALGSLKEGKRKGKKKMNDYYGYWMNFHDAECRISKTGK